jgi:hypothetical protein
MSRRFIFASVMAAGLGVGIFFSIALAEVVYPIIAREKEVKRLVHWLNSQGIKVARYALEEKKFEKVKFDRGSFSFTVEEIGGAAYTFYKTDINNDGRDEYVLTEKGDIGRWFDISAVYTQEKGKLQDIYEEVRLPLRALLRDAQHASYNLEDGFVGIPQGDMIMEEEGGRIFFSIVESHGSWYYCPKTKNAKCRWVREDCPQVYTFFWSKQGIELVKAYKRCLKGSDFRKLNHLR